MAVDDWYAFFSLLSILVPVYRKVLHANLCGICEKHNYEVISMWILIKWASSKLLFSFKAKQCDSVTHNTRLIFIL